VRANPPPQSVVLVDPQARLGAVGEPSLPSVVGRRGPLMRRLQFALPTNKTAPLQLEPWRLLSDDHGYRIGDSDGNLIGQTPVFVHRILFARRTNRMPISRRYSPEKDPAESAPFGLSFENVIPRGLGIASGTLSIFTNVAPPVAADSDWTVGAVTIEGRVLYATLGGGRDGVDYILKWTATDSDGFVWPRSTLVLCAATS
jgi:hypothetical protein